MVMSHLCDEMWALVTVYFRDQKIGLYRARHVEGISILLKHGAVSFPVGTAVRIEVTPLPDRRSIEQRAGGSFSTTPPTGCWSLCSRLDLDDGSSLRSGAGTLPG